MADTPESLFNQGCELFEDEKFKEARTKFQEGVKEIVNDGEQGKDALLKKLKMWVRKCDTHLEEGGGSKETEKEKVHDQPPPPKPTAQPKSNIGALVRNEWFQTVQNVTFSFYVKNRKSEDVQVDTTERGLEVIIKLDEGREFQHSIENFFAPVDKNATKVDVRSMKVEVVVTKSSPAQWPTLELAEGMAVADVIQSANTSASQVPNKKESLPAAYSGTAKDWTKFKLSEEEEKELEEGDPTNKFFKQIFSGGSDETRKAMMKSFQESNGTVLSTNWSEVSKGEVKGEAPKGMEMKRYEQ